VATVKKGAVFKAGTGTPGLSCATNQPSSSVTIEEGFVGAWSDMLDETRIEFHFKLAGVPDGKDDEVVWLAKAEHKADLTPADGTDNKVVIGTLTAVAPKGVKDGSEVIYTYSPANFTLPLAADAAPGTTPSPDTTKNTAAAAKKRSFKVTGTADFGSAAKVGLWVELWPESDTNNAGEKSDLDSVLSFTSALYAPPNADDESDRAPGTEWLVTTECITYLLYPFVTCGATPGWDTGISVSNTSPDPNNVVFGEFDSLKGQSGSVTAYAFPKAGNGAPPLASQITPNLPAGNTLSFTCSTNAVLTGFEGYMIIKAGFQQARGMAFVTGNFPDGAGLDVAHGYVAEVIGEGDPTARADAQ
jgi:hypothetical protein